MRTETTVLLESLKFELMPNGDIRGVIHAEDMKAHLDQLTKNTKGCIYFYAIKKSDPKSTHTHYGPRVPQPTAPTSTEEFPSSPSSLNGHHTLPDDYTDKW